MSPDQGRSLTRREFDDVIRRASELAARESDSGEDALDEGELLRIASEVGLSERHVRMALVELHSGAISPAGGAMERLFGPEAVRAGRVVPGAPRELAAKLDEFLVGGQLLQAVRRTDRRLQYRPAVDWASQVARAASATSRRYYVAAARSVEIRLEETEPGQALVDIEVDPGTRSDSVAGAVAGTLAGAAGGGWCRVRTRFSSAARGRRGRRRSARGCSGCRCHFLGQELTPAQAQGRTCRG